jgi:uncharacterized protein (TIGR03067 family)
MAMIEYAALVLLAVIPSPFSEVAKKELKALAGEWEYVKADAKNETIDIAATKPHFLTIVDGKWEVRAKGEERVRERAVIVALDTSTDPKIMDLRSVPSDPQREWTVIECVYKIDGDTLTIAMYMGRDKKRPVSFDASKETETIVWTLKRVKK